MRISTALFTLACLLHCVAGESPESTASRKIASLSGDAEATGQKDVARHLDEKYREIHFLNLVDWPSPSQAMMARARSGELVAEVSAFHQKALRALTEWADEEGRLRSLKALQAGMPQAWVSGAGLYSLERVHDSWRALERQLAIMASLEKSPIVASEITKTERLIGALYADAPPMAEKKRVALLRKEEHRLRELDAFLRVRKSIEHQAHGAHAFLDKSRMRSRPARKPSRT